MAYDGLQWLYGGCTVSVMTTDNIDHDAIQLGDHLIVQNPHRPRFAIRVGKIGEGRQYLVGRLFSIATFERDGLVAFSGTRTKIVSLRPTTSVRRIEPVRTMTGATNMRTVRALAIVPGHHLWVVASDGHEWAGPRITSTYFHTATGEIECTTVNGGRCYVLPSDLVTICDHPHLYGDVS
jgi:hypothetical protein